MKVRSFNVMQENNNIGRRREDRGESDQYNEPAEAGSKAKFNIPRRRALQALGGIGLLSALNVDRVAAEESDTTTHALSVTTPVSSTTYTIGVTGEITPGSRGDSVSDNGKLATGKVWSSGLDDYTYSGSIVALESDGPLTLEVDGNTISSLEPSTDSGDSMDGLTIIDDFVQEDLEEVYRGQTSHFDIISSDGSKSLSVTDIYGNIASEQYSTPRGREYIYQVTYSADSFPWMLAHIQNVASRRRDSYEIRAGPGYDVLEIKQNKDGQNQSLAAVDYSFEADTTYHIGFASGESSVKATVYDENLDVLAETDEVANTTHEGGFLGWEAGDVTGPEISSIGYRSFESSVSESDSGNSNEARDVGGVPSDVDGTWQVNWEDDFEGDSLDDSKWEVGFGWGTGSTAHDGNATRSQIEVNDSVLTMSVENGNPPYSTGSICTLDRKEFQPSDAPSNAIYLESRLKSMSLPGTLPAFWSKTARDGGTVWPPEIDFAEIPLSNSQPSDFNEKSIHHIHYPSSTDVGDSDTHQDYSNGNYDLSTGDFQDSFHIFGCLWSDGQIAHFVDGELVGKTTDNTLLRACENGAPFYMMLSMQPNFGGDWIGEVPDGDWSDYSTEMEIDYVRIWHQQ